MKKHLISLSTVFILIIFGKLFISSSSSTEDTYALLFENRYNVFALELPDDVVFAGERTPLEVTDIKERFDRELHVNTYWQSQTLLLIKRAHRYFPIIRPILKRYGVPDDFKYLPLIESGFQDMVSPAGAEGPWQFLPATARTYGLEVTDEVDERYHVAKATEAACRYLKDAYKTFGNWTMVAASYNMGPYGLQAAAKRQKAESYYDLDLNNQTARYVFRLLAIKEIMEHPKRYGFQYLKRHLYNPIPTRGVTVDSTVTDLVAFAESQGVNYKILRDFNPWLKSYKLSNPSKKTYYIYLPKEKNRKAVEQQVSEDTLLSNIDIPAPTFFADTYKVNKNAVAPDGVIQTPVMHEVKSGENLSEIAKHYKVKVDDIKKWNNLETSELKPGQKLKIYSSKVEKEPKRGR